MLQLTVKLLVIVFITGVSFKVIDIKREGSEFLNSYRFKMGLYSFLGLTLLIVRLIWLSQIIKDETWGKLLHTELSNFSATVILIGLILRKDSLIKIMLPWFLIAGALPLLFNNVWDSENFLGTLFSYIGHALMYFAAMLLILTVSVYSREDFIKAFMVIVYFLIFVFIVSGIPYIITGNVHFGIFATGMFPPSYTSQEVGNVIINHYVFLGDLGIYPIGTIVFYTLATLGFCIGVWFIKRVQGFIGIHPPELRVKK